MTVCLGDQWRAGGEEPLFLELDALPGRIAQHTVEAALVQFGSLFNALIKQ
jgi:hypothetical protein